MQKRKGVAIVIVWGVLIMLSMLAITALRLMGNQGFITESSVRRVRAYYTAKAAMVKTFEACRKSGCPSSTIELKLNNLTAKTSTAPASVAFCNGCTTLTTTVSY